MVIGIMGAMPEEVEIIKQQIVDLKTLVVGTRDYHSGTINGVDVVLVFSRWGKVASATTATTLITRFNVKQLIFTGVAGGIAPQLNIGDIVIANSLFQHDMDPRPLFPKHEIPLTGTTFIETDCNMVERAKKAAEESIHTVMEALDEAKAASFTMVEPKCVVGLIASGDQFVSQSTLTDEILNDKPETLAVDMESAAVAQVCTDYNVPFVIIRAISDSADENANINFLHFIAEVARYYSDHMIRNMFADKTAIATITV